MPRVVGFDEANARMIQREKRQRTPYLDASAAAPNAPYAFMTKSDPGLIYGVHYHSADQWQFIAAGKGKLGRDEVGPYYLHFSRAYTPYGPLQADAESGMTHFDLYTHYQPGARYLPENREALQSVPGRKPWQIKREVIFPSQRGARIEGTVELESIPDIRDDNGLFACSLTMAANASTTTPDASTGEGQYIVVVTGSLLHEGRELQPISVVFIAPSEKAMRLQAGPSGLEALVLNFPRVSATAAAEERKDLKRWECELCAFVYDEALGLPEDGIAPGTRWQDVPESWSCPDCSATKSDFQMIEID